ncbi:MAG: SpoIID/LytB domain-containing protein [FCB group bacterium]|nr:SpoIID/LytB domain-containing protein [FCB group bacterium]
MLERGTIPRQEPTIQVGLVLPEDHQTDLTLTFPHPEDYSLDPRDQSLTGSITISTDDEQLFLEDVAYPEIQIRHRVSNNNHLVTLDRVIAGRGFHWQKWIPVTVAGDLIVRPFNGSLIVINRLSVEDYLMSVATSEMGADCPSALIEAQTIVARSWLLAAAEQKHADLGMDVCNDDCCQRYQGSAHITAHSRKGVEVTRGQVLLIDGEICDARYSKSCGGMTESFTHIWPGTAQSCFQVFSDTPAEDRIIADLTNDVRFEEWIAHPPKSFCSPSFIPEDQLGAYLGHVDESGHYFRWKTTFSQDELTNLINAKLGIEAQTILSLKPENRGGSGRLNRLSIVYESDHQIQTITINSEYEIRRVLHPGFLYSSAFIVETDDQHPPSRFTLRGAGWGHGAGLCQIGALGMALAGYDARSIVEHYYPGAELTTIYTKEIL